MKPKGAKFYKAALQVNSYRYNHDYRNGELFDEDTYNQKIVDQCQKEGIEVIGLAEHGSVDLTDKLRQELIKANITVFPGFELQSAEKIHIICLFPTDSDKSWLMEMLGALKKPTSKKNEENSNSELKENNNVKNQKPKETDKK